MEEWKDIIGFDGYQVSSLGRVRSHNKITHTDRHGDRHWKNRIIKQKISKCDGRARVCLWVNGREHTMLVHRIQAVAFLGQPPTSDYTVNHIDGNPLNNVVDNLEWVTRSYNIQYGFDNGQYSASVKTTLIDSEGESYTFRSLAKASEFLGYKSGYISDARKKVNWANRVIAKNGVVYSVSIGDW